MGTQSAVKLVAILLLCSATRAIRVPINWASDSEVSSDQNTAQLSQETSAASQQAIPVEYFQYPAKKPQFAVDVATYHGVKNPENHYTAYPIRPHGQEKPVLGKHKLLDENNPLFEQFQKFTQINEGDKNYATPVSANYEVFHPYKAEEPALQELYKDPVLGKIRNDIYNSQSRLKEYENEAGKPDIQDGEYLESPEQTDRKKHPQRNIPVPYEIHRPQRRPVYYRPSPNFSRDRYLNHKFRHPWNQHNAKIRPVHYRPLKNHIHRLRQNHAVKFDDEHNEYPQVPTHEQISEVPEGYDIYERGKSKYIALRNNVDESINNAVKENRPTVYQRLELQNNGGRTETQISDDEEPEFVPIKNYAQVRKTETMKHLPREAAFREAASFDEIKNAPRLKEAIKSTKAQIVYTEEGYEDAAYDHAGEEKHAAENEGHGGFLKEKEISGGKYKAPSLAAQYQDASGNEYRDQVLHGEKWNNDEKDKEEENDEIDLSEDENQHSIEDEVYEDVTGERNKRQNIDNSTDESKDSSENKSNLNKEEGNEEEEEEENIDSQEAAVERSKRENKPDNNTLNKSEDVKDMTNEHEVNKRQTAVKHFKVPEINFNTTFLTPEEILKIAKLKVQPKQQDFKEKYPYYFKNLKTVQRDSPLRYAENLKLIPKKSKGGTEFYDSRNLECPEVEDNVDPLPEKLKKGGNPDSDESDESGEDDDTSKSKDKADFEQLKKNRRLKGLGDKIDCFKSKFFGENPLDSPFFKEEIISNPEPITAPNLPVYKFISQDSLTQATTLNNVFNASEKLRENTKFDLTALLDKLRSGQKDLQESLVKTNQDLKSSLIGPQNISLNNNSLLSQQTNVYTDVLDYIKNNQKQPTLGGSIEVTKQSTQPTLEMSSDSNVTYNFYQNKEDVTKQPQTVRKKRAAPFVYQPYKIIRDGQVQESKKTTTTSNISPLIRQLQSSRVIDKVKKTSDEVEQPVNRQVASRLYKELGRKDREKNSKPDDSSEASFVDVNVDKRRGEPRYEVRIANHKSEYTPVDNKKAMSVEDYETQTNKTVKNSEYKKAIQNERTATVRSEKRSRQRSRQRRPTTAKPYFDVSQYIPKSTDVQRTSASTTVNKVVQKPSTISRNKQKEERKSIDENEDEEEDYEEYDDEEVTTTTTTTTKPSFRRRRPKTTTTTTTTTEKHDEEEEVTEYPKLRLITRFRSTVAPIRTTEPPEEHTENPDKINNNEDIEVVSPKYREKKKKSSKSTLVTDTKTYGDDNDDMMKDAVDAMIGVKQNMDDYTPNYEKEINEKSSTRKRPTSSSEEDDDDDDEYDSDEEDDDEFDDDDDDEEEEEDEENESTSGPEAKVTTPEPTKRTLVRTTEAPLTTTETRSAKLEQKPIIHKKKIEIHKEIPVNKSSPHITQFKQDIKEIEIIKEMPAKPQKAPHRKPQKNLEALELYKDENLPKEINKLHAVEVFKEDLDLRNGPKHGGNYRSAQLVELKEPSSTQTPMHGGNLKAPKDPETSQSENTKQIELSETLPARRLHGGNLRSRNSEKNAKLELEDPPKYSLTRLHGGNLKSIQDKDRRRGINRSAKLIELDEDRDDDDSEVDMHGGNFKSYDNSRSRGNPLHGGNYRNAKLIKADDEIESTTVTVKGEPLSNPRSKSAVLLNSFAQAVPILTTTPAYILDPSKRMYYYVDA